MSRPAARAAALYFGSVMHCRMRPFRHRFRYRVFSAFLDIERIGEVAASSRLFSHNRFNVFSFDDHDHGPRDGSALGPWVRSLLRRHGLPADGRVMLLCFPRILGYVFNPLSIYFCYDRNSQLAAVLHEVKNTFGEQHGYLLEVPADRPAGATIVQQVEKAFYVSPFIGMRATYRFRLHEPDERLSILIRQHVADGELLVAAQVGRRAEFTERNLLRAFFLYPMMSLKVIAAIHWEALRLWLKGARLQERPAPPADVSFERRADLPPGRLLPIQDMDARCRPPTPTS